jgi:starch synthase
MSKKRVLFVTQEMNPYTTVSEISELVKALAPKAHGKGMEVRVLMPKYGNINERRHRLHEVVRLSGMNIIVDDDDYPLIIKVASLPGARLQVYFLENEEFFKRKFVFEDEDGNPFEDNQERMVFFCKGVIETVRKFGWAPDIIHCHGWMSSLVPFYLKTVYNSDPIFENAQIIYSAYKNGYEKTFNKKFFELAAINNLEKEDLEVFKEKSKVKLLNAGMKYVDAIVKGTESLLKDSQAIFDELDVPKLDYHPTEEITEHMLPFYKGLFEKES